MGCELLCFVYLRCRDIGVIAIHWGLNKQTRAEMAIQLVSRVTCDM